MQEIFTNATTVGINGKKRGLNPFLDTQFF